MSKTEQRNSNNKFNGSFRIIRRNELLVHEQCWLCFIFVYQKLTSIVSTAANELNIKLNTKGEQ